MKFITIFLLLSCSCYAQLDLTYSKRKSLAGITTPQLVGEEVVIGDDSGTPTVINGVVIQTISKYEFVELEVLRNGEEIEPRDPVSVKREVEGKTETITKWVVKGEGIYKVTARAVDMKLGFKKAKIDFLIGVNPNPRPIPIDPVVPPTPIPIVDNLSPLAKEIRAVAVFYVQGMGDDYIRLSQGNFKTVLEVSAEANKLDLVTRAKFKNDMGRLMAPVLGNDQLPINYPKIFQEISSGFKGVK